MSYIFPEYSNIDIDRYKYYQGSFVLGFIRTHCEDVEVIGPECWKDYENYDWLDQLISNYLANGKKVLLVPNEEYFIFPAKESAQKVLNSYCNSNVWLVTQLSASSQTIYTHTHQLTIKILELPYVLLEICENYYKIHHKFNSSDQTSGYNFLCMTGRFEPHKGDLIQLLHESNLNKYGLITIASNSKYPNWIKENCLVNKLPLVTCRGEYLIDRLTRQNAQNFLNIESNFKNIPLVVHAETSCGIFYPTEKSIWPLLLGKLYLGFGPPQNMKHIQQFYDVQFDDYLDLTFDEIPEDWSAKAQKSRMKTMIEKNYELIRDCKSVYNKLQHELETARWTVGKNFYNFFVSQLQTIT